MVEGRTVTAGVMFAVFATMVGLSLTYPPDARLLPLVIGIPGTLLSAAQFVIELRTKPDRQTTPAERTAELRMFGWFLFFVIGIILFGFPYAGPLMVALYLHLSWREKWYVTLGSAVFAWAVLYGVFEEVLGLPLFEGLVVQYFNG
jgi:hypothetical protein